MEEKAREIKAAEAQANDLNVRSDRLRQEVEDKEKERDGLKNQINSEENKLVHLRKSIQDCTSELNSRRGKVEAMKNIQRELELKKQLRQMSSGLVKHEAPINYTSQQNATEAEVVIEDALMHHGISTLLERHEVSSVLRGSLKPAEFILELVEGEIREEVDLQDSLVENWVLLFEDLLREKTSLNCSPRPKKWHLFGKERSQPKLQNHLWRPWLFFCSSWHMD